MDQYDNIDDPGSDGFLRGLTEDLAMINRLADDRGKIAALSEFGYSPQGMKTTGNGDLQWFTNVLNAIKSDPDAKRTAYMQTWANFALNGNLFVPYKNAPTLGDHELLPDFTAYFEDAYTAFAGDLSGVYDMEAAAAAEKPFLHIATPTEGTELNGGEAVIRARVLFAEPSKVEMMVPGRTEAVPMSMDADGYYAAAWTPDAEAADGRAEIVVKADIGGETTLEAAVQVRIGSGKPPIRETLYDFESSQDGWTIKIGRASCRERV